MKYLKPCLTLLISALLVAHTASAGKVYKIIDEKTGKITFTDKPQQALKSPDKQVETVHLPTLNTQQPPVTTPRADATPTSLEQVPPPSANYKKVVIASPLDQSTITPGQQKILVQLKILPELQEGHSVQLYYDNQKYGQPAKTYSFTITSLIRGAHNISADIINTEGKTVASTPTITVFVKQASRLNPPPGPKPPPKNAP